MVFQLNNTREAGTASGLSRSFVRNEATVRLPGVDTGRTQPATGAAIGVALLSFGVAALGFRFHSLAALVAAAVLLDGAVQLCDVLSLRSLYIMAPELRGRLNGLFLTFIFLCAAVASALAAALYTFHGWGALCALGAGFGLVGLLYYGTEFRRNALAPPHAAALPDNRG